VALEVSMNAIPGPRGWPLLGSLPELTRDSPGFWMDLATRYGTVAAFRSGVETCHLVSDPALVGSIFQHDTQGYYKGRHTQRLASLLGEGLALLNGPPWRQRRQLLQPAFGRRPVSRWLDIVTAAWESQVPVWDQAAAHGQPVEMVTDLLRLTQEIIVHILFGRSVPYQVTAPILSAVDTLNRHLLRHLLREMVLGGRLNRWPLPSTHRFQTALATLHATLDGLIAGRNEGDQDEEALVAFLSNARDEQTDARLTPAQIRDELIHFFLAGQETTAVALAWVIHHLTTQPQWAEGVASEADHVLSGRFPTIGDLSRLALTHCVINESLRLTPPVYGIGRRTSIAVEWGGWRIPAESVVIVSPYVMHRHPDYWDSPTRFDPHRFSFSPHQPPRPRYTYFPFGGGPRRCLGRHLALMEMLAITAQLARRYRFHRVPGPQVVPRGGMTLRPHPGVRVRLSLR
jgi:cytochrome P450